MQNLNNEYIECLVEEPEKYSSKNIPEFVLRKYKEEETEQLEKIIGNIPIPIHLA